MTAKEKAQVLSDLALQIAVLAKARTDLSNSLERVENSIQRAKDLQAFVEAA